MNRNKKTDGVQTVTHTAEAQTGLDTELVDKSTTKDTNDGESTVEGGVHVVSQSGISLATSTETTKSVEHAGTHETNESDHSKLDTRRSIPGKSLAKEMESSVHPTAWKVDVGLSIVIVCISRDAALCRRGSWILRHCFCLCL